MRLLTAREHSRQELRGKLCARGHPAELVEQVVDDLAKAGLQSDERFTGAYIESRVRRGSGPLRIHAELRERGIGDKLIAQQLEGFAGQWWDELRRVHDSKYGSQAPADRKEMARRARFLEYRGFPAELIRQLLWHHE